MINGCFAAMGTTVEVFAATERGLHVTREHFVGLERRFSRFLEHSELTQINRAPEEQVDVSMPMATVLAAAKEMQLLTGGLVDPAAGAAVANWGYDRSFELVLDQIEAPTDLSCGEWAIDNGRLCRQPGVALDLGGIVKGWAADQAIERELAVLVSAGGDVRSAVKDAEVAISDNWNREPVTVTLGTGGLATSAVSKRRWLAAGHDVHHIIDPRTLAPAESPVVSATAVCPSAVEAEAAAKTVILQGEHGLAWADNQPWVDAAMVTWHDGSIYSTRGWEFAA